MTTQQDWPNDACTSNDIMHAADSLVGRAGTVADAINDKSACQALAAMAVTHDDLRLPEEWQGLMAQLEAAVGAEAVSALPMAVPGTVKKR